MTSASIGSRTSPRPEHLYQLGDGEFPPLKTLDATNLPVAASPLLGRERELEELAAMLSDGSRLVTITGTGGTGKTRLALQVAAELVGRFGDGVFWVPLAGLADPEVVSAEIAHTIGAREDLVGALRGKALLLLLDNFEHLLDAAPMVGDLLSVASELRVLVTSRSPLRISGEVEYPLDPLPPSDAVALFVERSRASGRTLARRMRRSSRSVAASTGFPLRSSSQRHARSSSPRSPFSAGSTLRFRS